MTSWKWEVYDGSGWISNSVRLASVEEAEAYGADLLRRWLAYSQGRASKSDDQVNYKWNRGQLEATNVQDTSTSRPE